MSRSRWVGSTIVLALAALSNQGVSQQSANEGGQAATTIYFVRHGEVDASDPTLPLDARGRERAQRLVRTLERVKLTHVFASHTLRSRQAVEPAAKAHGLDVVPLPPLGSELRGQVISEVSASNLAIGPLADALAALPAGSVALVGVNSDNLFAILNRLGVPERSEAPCELGDQCVPCLANTCFPQEYDNLWLLALDADRTATLVWLKYDE